MTRSCEIRVINERRQHFNLSFEVRYGDETIEFARVQIKFQVGMDISGFSISDQTRILAQTAGILVMTSLANLKCWDHGQENKLGAYWDFYALEILAVLQSKMQNTTEVQKNKLRLREIFEKLTANEKARVKKTLQKIEALN